MEKLDVENWKRKPDVIKSKLKKVGTTIIAKETLYILFPNKYIDKHLAILDTVSNIMGVMCVYTEDNVYGVMLSPGMIEIEPNEIDDVEINNESYVRIKIEKDEAFISNTTVVKSTDTIYNLFELFVLQGKVPWFLEYEDLLRVFLNIPKYTGTKVGKNSLPFEVFISLDARTEKDIEMPYRLAIKTKKDKVKLHHIGLSNVFLSYKATISKITGSYFKPGVTAAIVSPQKSKPTKLEYYLTDSANVTNPIK